MSSTPTAVNFGPEWMRGTAPTSPTRPGAQRTLSTSSATSTGGGGGGDGGEVTRTVIHRYTKEQLLSCYNSATPMPPEVAEHETIVRKASVKPMALRPFTPQEKSDFESLSINSNISYNRSSAAGGPSRIRGGHDEPRGRWTTEGPRRQYSADDNHDHNDGGGWETVGGRNRRSLDSSGPSRMMKIGPKGERIIELDGRQGVNKPRPGAPKPRQLSGGDGGGGGGDWRAQLAARQRSGGGAGAGQERSWRRNIPGSSRPGDDNRGGPSGYQRSRGRSESEWDDVENSTWHDVDKRSAVGGFDASGNFVSEGVGLEPLKDESPLKPGAGQQPQQQQQQQQQQEQQPSSAWGMPGKVINKEPPAASAKTEAWVTANPALSLDGAPSSSRARAWGVPSVADAAATTAPVAPDLSFLGIGPDAAASLPASLEHQHDWGNELPAHQQQQQRQQQRKEQKQQTLLLQQQQQQQQQQMLLLQQQQQQQPGAPPGVPLGVLPGVPSVQPVPILEWVYRDLSGVLQGPFESVKMDGWYGSGHFNRYIDKLVVRPAKPDLGNVDFIGLRELALLSDTHRLRPFTTPLPVPTQQLAQLAQPTPPVVPPPAGPLEQQMLIHQQRMQQQQQQQQQLVQQQQLLLHQQQQQPQQMAPQQAASQLLPTEQATGLRSVLATVEKGIKELEQAIGEKSAPLQALQSAGQPLNPAAVDEVRMMYSNREQLYKQKSIIEQQMQLQMQHLPSAPATAPAPAPWGTAGVSTTTSTTAPAQPETQDTLATTAAAAALEHQKQQLLEQQKQQQQQILEQQKQQQQILEQQKQQQQKLQQQQQQQQKLQQQQQQQQLLLQQQQEEQARKEDMAKQRQIEQLQQQKQQQKLKRENELRKIQEDQQRHQQQMQQQQQQQRPTESPKKAAPKMSLKEIQAEEMRIKEIEGKKLEEKRKQQQLANTVTNASARRQQQPAGGKGAWASAWSAPKPAASTSLRAIQKQEAQRLESAGPKVATMAEKVAQAAHKASPGKKVWGSGGGGASVSKSVPMSQIQSEELRAARQQVRQPVQAKADSQGRWGASRANVQKPKVTSAAPVPAKAAIRTAPVAAAADDDDEESFWELDEPVQKQQHQQQAPQTSQRPQQKTKKKSGPQAGPALQITKAGPPKPEFLQWCSVQLKQFEGETDAETFTEFLLEFDDRDVQEYVLMTLGQTAPARKFAAEFVKRRNPNFASAAIAYSAKPSAAATGWQTVPTKSGGSSDAAGPAASTGVAGGQQGKRSKRKKSQFAKADPTLLGFSVQAPPGNRSGETEK